MPFKQGTPERVAIRTADTNDFLEMSISESELLNEEDSLISAEPSVIHEGPSPFLIIRPTGLKNENSFVSSFRESGFRITDLLDVGNYEELALKTYPIADTDLNSRSWMSVQRKLEPENCTRARAILFDHNHLPDLDRIIEVKRATRKEVGLLLVMLTVENEPPFRTWIHPTHSSEASDLVREFSHLQDHVV